MTPMKKCVWRNQPHPREGKGWENGPILQTNAVQHRKMIFLTCFNKEASADWSSRSTYSLAVTLVDLHCTLLQEIASRDESYEKIQGTSGMYLQ
jgi:hypothetical protein